MLSVNSPKPQVVVDTLDQKEIEGVTFEVVRVQGLSVLVRANGDEIEARSILRRVLPALPEMKYKVVSVMLVDEQGRAI